MPRAVDHKEIVRALIERMTVTMPGDAENVVVRIQWIGGTSTERALRRPTGLYERQTDFPRMRRLVEPAVAVGQNAARIPETASVCRTDARYYSRARGGVPKRIPLSPRSG
jgi:hypothetical protein